MEIDVKWGLILPEYNKLGVIIDKKKQAEKRIQLFGELLL